MLVSGVVLDLRGHRPAASGWPGPAARTVRGPAGAGPRRLPGADGYEVLNEPSSSSRADRTRTGTCPFLSDRERLVPVAPTLVFTLTPGPVRWKLWEDAVVDDDLHLARLRRLFDHRDREPRPTVPLERRDGGRGGEGHRQAVTSAARTRASVRLMRPRGRRNRQRKLRACRAPGFLSSAAIPNLDGRPQRIEIGVPIGISRPSRRMSSFRIRMHPCETRPGRSSAGSFRGSR